MNQCKHSYEFTQTDIATNHLGVGELLKFYAFASKLSYTSLQLSLWQVNNLDANLSCFLLALIRRLRERNKIYIYVEIPSHMHVLYRNDFYNLLIKSNSGNAYDSRESVIPCKTFLAEDDDSFIDYLKRDFFSHRGMQNLSSTVSSNLRTAYIEVFNNVLLHANTHDLFTCGQFFPEKNILKFTLLDLGQGFLPKIQLATNGIINSDAEAIDWATLPGNSTKDSKFGGGGYGLQDILNYCRTSNGSLHIASGDCYWTMSGKTNYRHRLPIKFPGAMVNLIFRDI